MRTLPVAVISGARQTGKSYLAEHAPSLRGHTLLTLDDLDTREHAAARPADFVRQAPRLIVDEVQRVPELLLAIKQAVDEQGHGQPGRFVLTGSANLLLMRQVGESLAGRAGYVTVYPMTRRERRGEGTTAAWTRLFETPFEEWAGLISASDAPQGHWRDEARIGGFPRPALQLDATEREVWFRNYEATYLERDLRDLRAVGNLGEFRRFMRALALRIGGPVNVSDVARELGLEARTLRRWLDDLEVSYQVVRIEAYTRRRTARLRRRPKLYWVDPALALRVAGEHEPRGEHLEALILADLLPWAALDEGRAQVLYWRDEANREVDFVLERGGKLIAVEVKATERPRMDDWKHLEHFTTQHGRDCSGALLLHGGTEVFRAGERILAAPWWKVL